jgi:cytochrome c oxidase assembly protein subunit 15|tara:strand:- start:796 stop:1209 length:414 start_codon:yes stop_codon:yes gene_type:complete
MLNKINIKYLVLFSIALMLIQIIIGTGVREFIDDQIKFYGRQNKDLWLSNPKLNFYIHRTFSILIFLVNTSLFFITKKLKMDMSYIYIAIGLIFIEILLGVLMFYFSFPIMTQPMHLMIAILIISVQFYWYLKLISS